LESSPPLVQAVYFIHLFLAIFLCGVIWFVQTVHYPLFRRIGDYEFTDYHRRHTRFTGVLVGPAMVAELLTAIALVLMAPGIFSQWQFAVSLGLLALIWISTFLVQMPLHRQIRSESYPLLLRRLVKTNWIRTVGWSGRALLLSWLWMQRFAP
jgi:heme/copper-type cytochrome/quinol oxidase subunit 4